MWREIEGGSAFFPARYRSIHQGGKMTSDSGKNVLPVGPSWNEICRYGGETRKHSPASDDAARYQDTIREAGAITDHKILRNLWRQVQYRVHVTWATRTANTELF
jgi:hypothetical protein